jgi:hypothetical protein
VTIRSSVFSTPTHVMAHGHPFISPAYPSDLIPGVPIGINAFTRRLVSFDPWMLKDAGIIHSAFGCVLGPKGVGKSATLKILAARLMASSAGYDTIRVAINDYKPEGKESEYGEFSRIAQSDVFSIANASVNPFEPELYVAPGEGAYALGILGTARVMCEYGKKGDLKGYENTALAVAVYAMLQLDQGLWSPHTLFKVLRSLEEPHITSYFENLDKILVSQAEQRYRRVNSKVEIDKVTSELRMLAQAAGNHSVQEVQKAGDYVSTSLGVVLYGTYGGMFGNKDSLYRVLTQRAVTKDWRGVEPEAETLMRMIDTRIKIAAIENNRIDLLPHIELDDEKHKAMDNPTYAKSHSYFSEIARGTHTCNLSATHRLASIRKGPVGSELYNLGQTVINNLGFVIIGRQDNDPDVLGEIQNRYELSDADTRLLPKLPKFTFAFKLGESEPVKFVRIFATDDELAMLRTDGATDRMINRPDLNSADDLVDFAKANGVEYLGVPS